MFSKWFEPWKNPKNVDLEEQGSVYRHTVMQTYQGGEGTCYAHMGARLILQNILKLLDEEKHKAQWKYRSTCRKMLNTYKPPTPTLELRQCGPHGYLKMCMFLYLYYLITERYGINGGSISDCLTLYPSIVHVERPRRFTEAYNDMYATASRYLHRHPPTLFQHNYVELHEGKSLDHPMYSSLVQLIFLFLKNNMYIGCRFHMTSNIDNGHLFMITGYSASKRAFYVKNSWGTFVSMLKVKYFGRPSIIIDNERWRARINLFMFVYTRPEPLYFHTVSPEVVVAFRELFSQNPVSHTRRRSRIPVEDVHQPQHPLMTSPSYTRRQSRRQVAT